MPAGTPPGRRPHTGCGTAARTACPRPTAAPGLDFADSAIQDDHYGFYHDETGHYDHEDTDSYTVSGTLTLQ